MKKQKQIRMIEFKKYLIYANNEPLFEGFTIPEIVRVLNIAKKHYSREQIRIERREYTVETY